jgi:hypothetical protein
MTETLSPTAVPETVAERSCAHPFVGSRPFEKSDSAFYFGRSLEAVQLANVIAVSGVTVLYGESGVGKSSLLNTRLEAALSGIEPDWRLITFREWQTGGAVKLAETVAHGTGSSTPPSPHDIARTLVYSSANTDTRITLILDQFEEFFLFQTEEFSAIESELAKIVNRRDNKVNILLALRSDGLFLLDRLRLRMPHIFNSMFRLDPLSPKAGVETIQGPIEAYNKKEGAEIEVPGSDSAIVKALVEGSQRKAIVQRLSTHGRGEAATSGVGEEIVLPFLQLTLDALWDDCIVLKKKNRLNIEDLCRLADLTPGPNRPVSHAVGLTVQKHVDKILGAYETSKQSACAAIFERMVLPSGQKVTVQLKDLLPHLENSEKEYADEILRALSSGSNASLLKRVAPPPGEQEISYQIIHDAMAVPILDWIDRFNRASRIRSEKRKVVVRALLIGLGALAAVACLGVAYVWARGERAANFGQMLNFADLNPISGFRLPLLLSLSALDQATNQWWWLLDRDRASEVLVKRLAHAPRFGGTFAATGFDPESDRIAWLDKAGGVYACSLLDTENCEQSQKQTFPVLSPQNLEMKSRNAAFQTPATKAIGYVDGIESPVVISNGFIHYLSNGSWDHVDVDDIVSNIDTSGFVSMDIGRGKIRVNSSDWKQARSTVFTVVFNVDEKEFVKSVDVLKFDWGNTNKLVPMTSASGKFAVAIYVEGDTKGLTPCQSLGSFEQNADMPNKAVTLNVWAAQGDPWKNPLCSTPLPQVRPGLGFSNDEKWVGAIFARNQRPYIQVFNATNGAKPEYENEFESLGAGGSAGGGGGAAAEGPPFTFGTLALHAGAPANSESQWRFAWQTPTGVRVEPGGSVDVNAKLARGRNSSVYQYGSVPPPQSPLLAWKLGFSDRGSLLAMQSMDFREKQWTIMVWDLSKEWGTRIQKLVNDGGKPLRDFVCEVASFDPSSDGDHPVFTDPEAVVWQPEYAKPCG